MYTVAFDLAEEYMSAKALSELERELYVPDEPEDQAGDDPMAMEPELVEKEPLRERRRRKKKELMTVEKANSKDQKLWTKRWRDLRHKKNRQPFMSRDL
eukprot:s598_g18.t1